MNGAVFGHSHALSLLVTLFLWLQDLQVEREALRGEVAGLKDEVAALEASAKR